MNPTGLELPALAAAFVFGLLGSAHCIGMCGGIMSVLTFNIPPSMRQPARLTGLVLGYNLGRITSYAMAGASAATLGSVVTLAPGMHTAMQLLSALMMMLMALYIANFWKGLRHVERLGRHLWQYIEPAGRRLLPVVHIHQAVVLGAIWGWLPCGLVYSMLTWSLSSADTLEGALLLTAFGLGTLPALLLNGLAARQLQHLLALNSTRWVAAALIVTFAIWQTSRATMHL